MRTTETRSARRRAFETYLRTGRRVDDTLETKFNPWHDPADGRFTFGPGVGGSGSAHMAPRPDISRRLPRSIPPGAGHSITVSIADHTGTYKNAVNTAISLGQRRVWPVAGNGRPARNGETGPNGKPYADGRFSMEGRYRRHRDGTPKRHTGIDLPAKVGDPVLAAASGTVLPQSYAKGYGNVVVIDHGDGTSAAYAHLSERSVKAGQRVAVGQEIGKVGTTGNSGNSGSHLHFEILLGTRPVLNIPAKRADPAEWMKRGALK